MNMFSPSQSFIAFVLVFCIVSVVEGTFIPANDERFVYTGRWQEEGDDSVVRADWPCSGVKFNVTTSKDNGEASSITLRLRLRRVRVNVVVTNGETGLVESATILEDKGIFDFVRNFDIPLDHKYYGSTYTVSMTKLTQGSPYMNGVGKSLKSVIQFHGVELDQTRLELGRAPRPSRRMTLIGASDTAGYCVDGTPETSDATYLPWKYDNCDMTSHAVLGRRLDAETSVQAIAGIGLTQNAFADKPFLLGRDTMPDYYNRVLQTEEHPLFDFDDFRPDLVVVSLGGNDFNHQKEPPSNSTFSDAYEEFLEQIAKPYLESGTPPTIVSVCGQGDPTEHERDPNNDRCRPCPHVQDATEAFRTKQGDKINVQYIFIPCDGSVVTGKDDIGCEGHKNSLGQERVADYLEPRLREIMGWPSSESDQARLAETAESFQMALERAPTLSVGYWSNVLLLAPCVGLLLWMAMTTCRRFYRFTSSRCSYSKLDEEEEEDLAHDFELA